MDGSGFVVTFGMVLLVLAIAFGLTLWILRDVVAAALLIVLLVFGYLAIKTRLGGA